MLCMRPAYPQPMHPPTRTPTPHPQPRSEPPGECVAATAGGNRVLNIVAFVLTLLSVAYTCWSSSVSSDSFNLGTPLRWAGGWGW